MTTKMRQSTQAPSLATRAAAAHAELVAERRRMDEEWRQQRRRQRAEALTSALRTRLGVEDVRLDTGAGGELEAVVDGLRFDLDTWDSLVLVRTCPTCGERVSSAPIRSLADLGAELEEPEAPGSHTCVDTDEDAGDPPEPGEHQPERTAPATTAERLAEAIGELVNERMAAWAVERWRP